MNSDPDETALLRAVVENPDADAPRLAYAGWLEEQGRTDRARLIRVQCQRERLDAEERELIAAHGREWGRPLLELGADGWRYRRGFPEEITIGLADFLAGHAAINRHTPFTHLHLSGNRSAATDADLEELADLPAARQIRGLEFGRRHPDPDGTRYGPAGLRALARSPYLTGLRELRLHSPNVGPMGLEAIAGGANFAGLAHLAVTDPTCGTPDCLLRVAQSPNLASLVRVELGDGGPTNPGFYRTGERRSGVNAGGPPSMGTR